MRVVSRRCQVMQLFHVIFYNNRWKTVHQPVAQLQNCRQFFQSRGLESPIQPYMVYYSDHDNKRTLCNKRTERKKSQKNKQTCWKINEHSGIKV